MRIVTILSTALVLSACATGPLDQTGTFLPPLHEQHLAVSKLCCSSYEEMPFVKMKPNEEAMFTLSPDSPVFLFPQGRSYFVAYELPNGARALTVKTFPVNMLLNRFGHVLVPGVVFLDEKRDLIEIVRPTFLPRNPKVIGDSWAEASVVVPAGAKFGIVMNGRSQPDLAWRDSDQRSGYLHVRSGPTGNGSVLAN